MPDHPISASTLLRALHRRARREGLAPPAAFLGDWHGHGAVILPSVDLRPCPPDAVFSGADDLVVVGFRSFPDLVAGDTPLLPAAVRGTTTGLLALGADGTWRRHGDAPDPAEVVREEVSRGTVRGFPPEREGDDDEADLSPDWAPPDRAAHRVAVEDCLETIRAGEVYQACLSTRLTGRLRTSPLETFLSLARRAPAARAGYLEGPWGAVLGFSPEEFLVRTGRDVRTSPIKGTLPAHRDPAELLASAKDVAENIMIVDLARNDLGRVAEIGSVVVSDLLDVRPAPGVHHLVSTVTARTGVSHDALVAATFPPASVTGTPKARARELIAGWEPRSRGLHCGAYGLAVGSGFAVGAGFGGGVEFDGEPRLELAVAIRTLEAAPDGRVELGVGGGITIDSDPDAEWDECLHKAAFTWGGGPAAWGG